MIISQKRLRQREMHYNITYLLNIKLALRKKDHHYAPPNRAMIDTIPLMNGH